MKVAVILCFCLWWVTQGSHAQTSQDRSSQIEKITQIFYLNPSMRSPEDKVWIDGSQLHLRIWKDLPPDPQADKVECSGYQWLLTGRGQRLGHGSQKVFETFADLQSIHLEFVEMETESKRVDGRGRLQKNLKPRVFLRMQIQRSPALAQMSLKKDSLLDLKQCLHVGRSLVAQKEVAL